MAKVGRSQASKGGHMGDGAWVLGTHLVRTADATARAWLLLLVVGAMVVGCGGDDVGTGGIPVRMCVSGATRACACPDGASGAQRCASNGSGYGSCVCALPDAGPTKDSGGRFCEPNATRVCACPGGVSGAQACGPDGAGYGTCVCPGTDAGTPFDGGSRVCEPNATRACACPGGVSGAQTCSPDGGGYGACVCPTADAGLRLCEPNATRACACPGGVSGAQTCVANGSGYGMCVCPSPDSGTPVDSSAVASPCPTFDIGSSIGMSVASGSTAGRASANRGSCGGDAAGEVSIRWVAPMTGAYTFDTRGSNFDTVVYLRSGSCTGTEVACNDDFASGQIFSQLTLNAVAGATYLIFIDGDQTSSGSWTLNVVPGQRADAGLPPADSGVLPDSGTRTDAGAFDPCRGVSELGRCLSTTQVQYCSRPTGNGTAQLVTTTCVNGEICQIDSSNFADCATPPGACETGASECLDATTVRTCVAGTWRPSSCINGCISTVLGSNCRQIRDTTVRALNVTYEVRGPRVDYSGWGDLSPVPAQGFLVLSLRGSDLIDVQVTDAMGSVRIAVPATPGPTDTVTVLAIGVGGSPSRILYAAANPGLAAGSYPNTTTLSPTLTPRFWQWQWPATSLPNALRIAEAAGSGAARVFDYLRYSYAEASRLARSQGQSLVTWVSPGVTWGCGACAAALPTSIGIVDFRSQIWIDGSATNQGYWSDPVTAHELGHWVMSSYGAPPGEGGPHIIGVPTMPGQAWSEGWATFVSSHIRRSPRYYDKQQGSMFWFDIGLRTYSGPSWPSSPTTLLGLVDENEVASILWRLGSVNPQPLYDALQSARMIVSPFGRCYTSRLWCLGGGRLMETCDSSESVPHLADMLDTMNCSGFPRTSISSAIGLYPYPVNAPFCTSGSMPTTCPFSGYPFCSPSNIPSCLRP
jgi:hypothetical protein